MLSPVLSVRGFRGRRHSVRHAFTVSAFTPIAKIRSAKASSPSSVTEYYRANQAVCEKTVKAA